MIEAEWWEYDSLDELADAVAGDVGFIIESAVDARDASLIAVPGGKTGPAVFGKLAKQKLPWKKVTVIPTDDRLVAVDSELSNVRELARAFLPLGARVVPLTSEAATTTSSPAMLPMRGCRTFPGRPTSCGSAWARTGIPPRSFPGRTCRRRSMRPRRGARSASMPDPLPAGSAGRASYADPRRDPVGAHRPHHDHWPAEARAARAGDRRRAQLEAADRPRARRGRAADRHPLVPVRARPPRAAGPPFP